jgi:Uma2 family endonuclease
MGSGVKLGGKEDGGMTTKTKPEPAFRGLDGELIEEAKQLGGHKTPKEAITVALQEYIQRRKRLKILELEGTIEYHDDYDPKALRKRKQR